MEMAPSGPVRERFKELTEQYEESENDLKALQSVGQIVGEVHKQLIEENKSLLKLQMDQDKVVVDSLTKVS